MRILVLAIACLASCNFVQMERNRLLEDLGDWGLYEQNVTLGEDTVRFWASSGTRPLLLLHGFGASAIWQYHGQRYLAGAGHKIVLPDLLWFGGSHSTRRDFSIDHQVDMLIALVDKVGFQRFDVVGTSYGGVIAYELARREPERVRRLVLINSPGPVFTLEDRAALYERLGTEDLASVLIPTEPEDVERLMNIAYKDPPWAPGFAERQAIDELYGQYREERAELLRDVMSRVGETEPEPINEPTLVVWGREDPFFPLEIGERLAEFLGARLFVVDDARHSPHMEHHKKINDEIVVFLR